MVAGTPLQERSPDRLGRTEDAEPAPSKLSRAREASLQIQQALDVPVERFPVEALPGPAQRLAIAGARSLGCPPDLIAVPVLAVLGTALGTQRCLEVKPGWLEYPGIYAVIVARPGGSKSPAQALATEPLHIIQEEFRDEHMTRLGVEYFDQEEKGRVPAECKNRKESGSIPAGRKAEGISSGESKAGKQPPPEERHIISSDGTTEAHALLMRQNPHGFMCEQDEATAFVRGFDRYRGGAGADRHFYSSAWSNRPITVHRIKLVAGARRLETIRIDRPFISIVACTQPEMLGELADEHGRQDGFADRFLLSIPNEQTVQYDPDGVDETVRQEYAQLIRKLVYRLPVSLATKGPVTTFTEEGHARWCGFMEAHNAEISDEGFPDHLRGPWKKMASYAARISLILQAARFACGEAQSLLVDETSVSNAIRLVNYFKSHAKRAYQHLRDEPANQRLAALLEWVAAQGGSASVREVLTARVSGCRTSGDVLALFERLKKAGVGEILTRQSASGGRPTISFALGVGGRLS